jgi:hypothetical protein
MTEKELIGKLNSMKSINLDSAWLKGNREVLYTQISNTGAGELSAWHKLLCEVKAIALTASKPAISIASLFIVLVSAGIFSHKIFSNAKPNESLYIARIISEKAKVNMTFNDQNRSKLEAKFAASHAQDIAAVLSGQNMDNDSETARNLSAEFDREINTVKENLARVTPQVETPAGSSLDNRTMAAEGQVIDNDQVFTADSSKASSGIEIDLSVAAGIDASQIAATSSIDVTDEVKQYFDNQEYSNAIDKLKEIEDSIK